MADAEKTKYKPAIFQTPKDAEVDVFAIKGEKIFKSTMQYQEALKIQKKPGFFYRIFQSGFSDMKATD